jgi:signal-transduction protein with cAMP-binding, CBS, and nucleotidyltransferase domain
MDMQYKPRYSIPLEPGTTYRRPESQPDWIRPEDPALSVFTDFTCVEPRAVDPDTSIDVALEQMKEQGVRLLLVTDADEVVSGLVTAGDIQGEKPIRLIEEDRVARADIRVRDVMTAQPEIPVLNMISVEPATVGHILSTLHQLDRQHVLVVEVDEDTGAQCIRGLFSLSQIRKQMHSVERDEIPPADSLADLVTGKR